MKTDLSARRHDRGGRGRLVFGIMLLLASAGGAGAAQTVGLFAHEDAAFDGYTLYGPHLGTSVYLLGNDGLIVNQWDPGVRPGLMGYLRDNGNLVRPANVNDGTGGRIEEYDWDGNLVWEYVIPISLMQQHHDIELMPNGNILLIGWETKTAAEAIAAGRDPALLDTELQPEMIVELQPIPPDDAAIVWEWRSWEHMIQDFDPTKANFGVRADHPELIDINFGQPPTPTHPDIHHANGLAYDPALDQIMVSVRHFSELWVIDHSTTTAEAAGSTGGNSGKGGDLLYRWGNPASYGRGTAGDRRLFFQHDTQWIAAGLPGAGNILIFNNGTDRPGGNFSSVDEIVPPVDQNGAYTIDPVLPYAPSGTTWSYTAPTPTDMYAAFVSGAQRQPNGNTLIIEGPPGHLFEVTTGGQVVWDFLNPIGSVGNTAQGDPPAGLNIVFKARRYAVDFPGFAGRDLTPGDPVELFNTPLPAPTGSLAASRLSAAGDQIRVSWDATTCTAVDYHLLYGDLAGVTTQTLLGAECGLGLAGTYDWLGAPAGSLYFLVVGTDATGVYESSWGLDGAGAERNGYAASFTCGATTKVVGGTCP